MEFLVVASLAILFVHSLTHGFIERHPGGVAAAFVDERLDASIVEAASAVRYRYPVRMDVYYTSPDGEIVKSDSESVLRNMYDAMGVSMGGASSVMLKTYASNMNVWEELLPGKNGELISESVTEQYDIVYGRWPQAADEVIIILNGNSELSDFVLYAIGLKSSDEFYKILRAAVKGYEIDSERKSWSYEEICSLSFRLILPCDAYQLQDNGSYLDLSETKEGLSVLYNTDGKFLRLSVVGIVRPNENALFNMLTGAVGYTAELTEYAIDRTSSSEIVKKQLSDTETDVLLGLPFGTDEPEKDDEGRIADFIKYYNGLDTVKRAALAREILSEPTDEYLRIAFDEYVRQIGREGLIEKIAEKYRETMGISDTSQIFAYLEQLSDGQLYELIYDTVSETIAERYRNEMTQRFAEMSDDQVIGMVNFDSADRKVVLALYNEYVPDSFSYSTCEDVLSKLGYVDKDSPSEILIYASTFSDKNRISDLVEEYNKGASEENKIKMTDYVELLMSSISTVINAVTCRNFSFGLFNNDRRYHKHFCSGKDKGDRDFACHRSVERRYRTRI